MIAPAVPHAGSGVVSVEWSADTLTPVAAALRLGHRLAFILESVEGGARYGRYSMVGVRGRTLTVDGSMAVVRAADGSEVERFDAALELMDAGFFGGWFVDIGFVHRQTPPQPLP